MSLKKSNAFSAKMQQSTDPKWTIFDSLLSFSQKVHCEPLAPV